MFHYFFIRSSCIVRTIVTSYLFPWIFKLGEGLKRPQQTSDSSRAKLACDGDNFMFLSQSEDKSFLRELRENALIYKQSKEQENSKRMAEEKDKRKKAAVREQMRVRGSIVNIPRYNSNVNKCG